MNVIDKLDVHPASRLLPVMSDEELKRLVEDIDQHGLMEPITVHDGKILDGRSRWTACVLAGVKPTYMQWTGLGEIPSRYVIAKNLWRLNLTRSQLAALAVQLGPIVKSEFRTAGLPLPAKFDEFLGKIVGVSHNSIFQARKIQETSPEEFEKLKKGDINCNFGYYRITRNENSETVVQPQEVRLSMKERTARVKELTSQGYLVPQIANELKISEELVYKHARLGGVKVHSSRAKRLDVTQMVDETISTAEALTLGLDIIEMNLHTVDASEKERWTKSLASSIRSLNKLLKQLRTL